MKRTVIAIVVIAFAIAALALLLFDWNPVRSKREAVVYHCNEEGTGGAITSREHCEELYARSQKGGAAQNSN